MRFLLKISVPNEQFNSYVRKGNIGQLMQEILADTKPEAVYFTAMNGIRTAMLVVNIAELSQIPAICEPWFLRFNASIDFYPAMLGEDLGKAGLEELGKKWG